MHADLNHFCCFDLDMYCMFMTCYSSLEGLTICLDFHFILYAYSNMPPLEFKQPNLSLFKTSLDCWRCLH